MSKEMFLNPTMLEEDLTELPLDLARKVTHASHNCEEIYFDFEEFTSVSIIYERKENERLINELLDNGKVEDGFIYIHHNPEPKKGEVIVDDIDLFRPLAYTALKQLSNSKYAPKEIAGDFFAYISRHMAVPASESKIEYGIRFEKDDFHDVKVVIPFVRASGRIPLSTYEKTIVTESDSPPIAVNGDKFGKALYRYMSYVTSYPNEHILLDKYVSYVERHAYYIKDIISGIQELSPILHRNNHTIFSAKLPEKMVRVDLTHYNAIKNILSQSELMIVSSVNSPFAEEEAPKQETLQVIAFLEESLEKYEKATNMEEKIKEDMVAKISNALDIFKNKKDPYKKEYKLNNSNIFIRCDSNLLDAYYKNKWIYETVLPSQTIPLAIPKEVVVIPSIPDFIPNIMIMDGLGELNDSGEQYLKKHPERQHDIFRQLGALAKLLHTVPTEGYGNYFDQKKQKFLFDSPKEYYDKKFDELVFNINENLDLNYFSLKEVLSYFETQITQIFLEDHADFRLMHGDLVPQNCLINQQTGEIQAVIDWDHAASVGNPLGGEFDRIILSLKSDKDREDFYEGFCKEGYGLTHNEIVGAFPSAVLHHIQNIFDSIVYNRTLGRTFYVEKTQNDLIRSVYLHYTLIGKKNTTYSIEKFMKGIRPYVAMYQNKKDFTEHPFEEMANFLNSKKN